MQLEINGESVNAQEGATLDQVLQQLGYSGEAFAVACNGDFVPRTAYGETRLSAGDCLDIVAPVVGG